MEEKNTYCQENRRSKVFQRNMQRLNEVFNEFPQKSVCFSGRNLYIVPSKEHNEITKKFWQKRLRDRKSLKKLQSEKKVSWSLEPFEKLN